MKLFKFPPPTQSIEHPLAQQWLEAIELAKEIERWPSAILTGCPTTIVHSQHTHGQIENLEYMLMLQQESGIIYYQAVLRRINITLEVLVAQLIENGTTRWMWYSPMNAPDQWWVEPWSVEHLLSNH